jgi:crotonobetainyl-CoA:carnitine CoA-transferase CaiB-like acyl-CoA transferase
LEPAHQTCFQQPGRQPVTLSRTPSRMVARPPEFGEQTDEVLTEFGFGTEEIKRLKEAKVV